MTTHRSATDKGNQSQRLDATTVYSYDANGNVTATVSKSDKREQLRYCFNNQIHLYGDKHSPCLEVDTNNGLYQSAVTRKFFDSQGRMVETLLEGRVGCIV